MFFLFEKIINFILEWNFTENHRMVWLEGSLKAISFQPPAMDQAAQSSLQPCSPGDYWAPFKKTNTTRKHPTFLSHKTDLKKHALTFFIAHHTLPHVMRVSLCNNSVVSLDHQ